MGGGRVLSKWYSNVSNLYVVLLIKTGLVLTNKSHCGGNAAEIDLNCSESKEIYNNYFPCWNAHTKLF